MSLIKFFFISVIVFMVFFFSCGGDDPKPPKFVKSPIDKMITKYIDVANYSVVLSDMDYKEKVDKYYHKYRILLTKAKVNLSQEELKDTTAQSTDIEIVNTDWQEVSPIVFDDHKNDLGMTVLSKEEGVLDKGTAPAGANTYVGNPRYGHWENHSNGSSFWAFYGRYRLMTDLFYGPRYGFGGYYGYPRSDWNTYRGSYRGKGDYYGNKKQYGTKSAYNSTKSTWSQRSNDFKSRVNSKVAKSSSALKSRGYTSRKSYSKTPRNTSRFSSSSSSRSRSGGFGK